MLVGHVDKNVIFKTMYYKFAEVAGVSSSLMASKDKGEGEGRVSYQTFVSADNVQRNCRLFFMLLEEQKLLNGED